MGFEFRIGKQAKPVVSGDFIESARQYSENRDIIRALRAASDSPLELIPDLPGFPDDVTALLQTDAGHGVLDTWLHYFNQTITLLEQYDAENKFTPKDLETITGAQQRAIQSLGQRAAGLVARIGEDGLLERGRAERIAIVDMRGQV